VGAAVAVGAGERVGAADGAGDGLRRDGAGDAVGAAVGLGREKTRSRDTVAFKKASPAYWLRPT
jgi:hypothetical protein